MITNPSLFVGKSGFPKDKVSCLLCLRAAIQTLELLLLDLRSTSNNL